MKIVDENGVPTKQLFLFLKYNTIPNKTSDEKKQTEPEPDAAELTSSDDLLYKEFCRKWKELIYEFDNNRAPSSILGGLMALFGFKRHYCGTCGIPIVGRFSKIGSMIACAPCYESFQIIQQLEKKESPTKKESHKNKKASKSLEVKSKE